MKGSWLGRNAEKREPTSLDHTSDKRESASALAGRPFWDEVVAPDKHAAAPAPPKIAVQIYTQATMTKMIAHCTQQGQSIDQAIAWAEDELEGFMRG